MKKSELRSDGKLKHAPPMRRCRLGMAKVQEQARRNASSGTRTRITRTGGKRRPVDKATTSFAAISRRDLFPRSRRFATVASSEAFPYP